MELFRRTLAGLLMLVVAVSVGIWVQGKFIDAVRLPTHTRMIGATYTTLSDPFYETINDEIQMQIKSNGDLLLVRDPGQDQERQNQEIEDMLNKGIELLIVNPVDYVGVTPALEKAREKGVPVILIDSKVDDPELVTCTITSNNYGAGLLDARHLISQTKSARIVLLSNSDSFSSWDRLSGFCQTLTKSGNDYRILELRDCGGELNRAMRAMVQLLETFPRIDVVMAVNEQAALGAMAALEEKGVLSSTLVYSVDGSPEAKALISEGLMTATSAQSPLRIGRMAAEVVYEILEGKPYLTNITVQEGITNAIRHGHATRVQVRCHIEDGVLEVSVRDNGIGCKSVTPGFGLQHMQERMLMLGGTFWYENSDGFCIRAEIPLRKTPGSEKRKQEETV